MRARVYDTNEKRYYISEVYGILNCGINLCLVDKIDDAETVALVEYMDFSSKPPYEIHVEKIDINTASQLKWVYIQKDEIECINALSGQPGKFHYFNGYELVWENKAALAKLIHKGYIDKRSLNLVNISSKLKGWNYTESGADIDYLMEQFCGFQDSVLKELSYITGDYVSQDGGMHFCEAGNKQIKLVFESQWARGIEVVLLAPRHVQLVPPKENDLADLYDASIFIRDCMVCFYDSYMKAMPETYAGTYFCAMGMMWKFEDISPLQ